MRHPNFRIFRFASIVIPSVRPFIVVMRKIGLNRMKKIKTASIQKNLRKFLLSERVIFRMFQWLGNLFVSCGGKITQFGGKLWPPSNWIIWWSTKFNSSSTGSGWNMMSQSLSSRLFRSEIRLEMSWKFCTSTAVWPISIYSFWIFLTSHRVSCFGATLRRDSVSSFWLGFSSKMELKIQKIFLKSSLEFL